MKRKETERFDEWLAEALAEAEDREAEEFMSPENDDVEISEELDRRIQGLMTQKSKKKIFQNKFHPKILSSAALIAFVTVCFAWVAMMSTFMKFPWGSSEQTQFSPSLESTVITVQPEAPPSAGDPGKQTESSNRGQQGSVGQMPAPRDPANGIYTAPSDELNARYIISQSTSDGICVKISVTGYQSESLGKGFYVKSNEYFTVTVEIKNRSASPIYRPVRTDCSPDDPSHSHDISLDLSCGDQKLCSSMIGFGCGGASAWELLGAGETYTCQLKYAPGEEVEQGFDLPGDGTDYPAGIKLYDETFLPFAKGAGTFVGSLSFDYKNGSMKSFSLPLSLEVLYVDP